MGSKQINVFEWNDESHKESSSEARRKRSVLVDSARLSTMDLLIFLNPRANPDRRQDREERKKEKRLMNFLSIYKHHYLNIAFQRAITENISVMLWRLTF